MLHPERVNGFAREHIACESVAPFRAPLERFHTSNPAEVSCWKCLRLLAEGRINLVPLTDAERAEFQEEHRGFVARMALRAESERAHLAIV